MKSPMREIILTLIESTVQQVIKIILIVKNALKYIYVLLNIYFYHKLLGSNVCCLLTVCTFLVLEEIETKKPPKATHV